MLKYIVITLFVIYTIGTAFKKNSDIVRTYIAGAFNFFWCIALLLSLIVFNGKYAVSLYAYVLIVISLFCFNFGFNKVHFNQDKHSCSLGYIIQSANGLINSYFFNTIVLLGVLYLFSLLLTYLNALVMASAADLRTDFFDEDANLYGSLFLILNDWLLKPFNILLLSLFPIALFQKKSKQSVVYCLYLILYSSLDGGRFGYTQIVWSIYLITVCIFHVIRLKFSIRNLVIGVVSFVLFYSTIAIITASRMEFLKSSSLQYEEIIEETNTQLASYASGPTAAFSYALENKYIENMGGYQYGKLTFGGIDQVFDIVLRKLGIGYERSLPKLAKIKQDSKIEISKDLTSWNALYTANLFFYLDFGIVGIVLLPYLFAFFIMKSIKLMFNRPCLWSLVLVNFLFINSMHSIFDYRLYKMSDLLTIIILLIIIRKKHIQQKLNLS